MTTGLRAGWIRRRWWVPVLTMVVAMTIGGLVSYIRPASYSASMVFVVGSNGTGISPDQAQDLASTYAALLAEDDLIAQAVSRAVKRRPGELKTRLAAANPVNTALIRVTYQGTSESEALAGMAALEDALTSSPPASPAIRSRSVLPVQAAKVTGPSSPLVAIILGAMFGLCAGAVLVIALERSDVRVDDRNLLAEHVPDIPVLGTVAPVGRHGSIPVQDRPFSPAAEGFQGIRVALERLGLGSDIAVLVVMSADRQEGKSTFAANLGTAVARQERSVVLISGDMRRPGLEKLLDVRASDGWAELLEDEVHDPLLVLVSVVSDLWLLSAGSPSGNPAELLKAGKMREVLKRIRDISSLVIIDTPPALQSADAAALAGVADGAVLVVRSGRSRLRSVRETVAGLRRDNIRVLGMVLVDHRDRRRRTYGYRGDNSEGATDPSILSLESHARRSTPKGRQSRAERKA